MVLFSEKCQHGVVGPTCIECYRLALADAQVDCAELTSPRDKLLLQVETLKKDAATAYQDSVEIDMEHNEQIKREQAERIKVELERDNALRLNGELRAALERIKEKAGDAGAKTIYLLANCALAEKRNDAIIPQPHWNCPKCAAPTVSMGVPIAKCNCK